MIRFAWWPQLGVATAFVTAVAVVLNPITPVLPDITVPALFPPAAQSRVPAKAAPHRPAVEKPAPAAAPLVVAPILAAPSVAAVAPASQPYPGRAFVPTEAPATAPAPAVETPAIEIPAVPIVLPEPVPPVVPAIRVVAPTIGMQHTGDRPRTAATRQPFGTPVAGPRPLPAAAVDPQQQSDAPSVDEGAVRQRARGQSALPDPGETTPRHRGATDRG